MEISFSATNSTPCKTLNTIGGNAVAQPHNSFESMFGAQMGADFNNPFEGFDVRQLYGNNNAGRYYNNNRNNNPYARYSGNQRGYGSYGINRM